jgi:hypothetical protein
MNTLFYFPLLVALSFPVVAGRRGVVLRAPDSTPAGAAWSLVGDGEIIVGTPAAPGSCLTVSPELADTTVRLCYDDATWGDHETALMTWLLARNGWCAERDAWCAPGGPEREPWCSTNPCPADPPTVERCSPLRTGTTTQPCQ